MPYLLSLSTLVTAEVERVEQRFGSISITPANKALSRVPRSGVRTERGSPAGPPSFRSASQKQRRAAEGVTSRQVVFEAIASG